MKKYYIIGLTIILALSIGIIYYCVWLNQRGEFQITQRMEENRVDVQGARVVRREIYPAIKLPTVKLYTGAMVDAVSLIDGRVISNLVPKNGFVRKGDVIFIVENETIPLKIKEAKAGILKAKSDLKRAENSYNRYKELRASDATSLALYDEAEAAYFAAQSNLEAAEAQLAQLTVQDSRQSVTAPIDGKIIVVYRQQGAYVQAGTPLAMVGDFSSLYFAVPMEDENASHLSEGQEVELIFSERAFQKAFNTEYGVGNLGKRQKFLARVQEITPPLSEPAVMRNVIWQLDNSSGLLDPQTYGNVRFRSREGHSCLAVPLSAMADSTKTAVFVVNEDGTIRRSAIKTGSDDGEWIEVISGLNLGEVVVTGGIEGLTDGMAVSVTFDSAAEDGNTRANEVTNQP
ncbi:MAG: efflux RND transporter periplasmic adaptor subunit [Selenomonadaceae bacterium]|nr:efflux RND transporter periplasmic adaptor subunit [Selenomonadaceae bacterium]